MARADNTMSYALVDFHDLCDSLHGLFPEWSSLRTWLESEEGGSLKIIDNDPCAPPNHVIIRYEKGVSNLELSHVRWFRSVVWNTATNRPVCVAPPKARASLYGNELRYEEFLEGFMINLYVTSEDSDEVIMVSRSNFNATGTFYSPKQFNELFREAVPEGFNIRNYIPSGMTFVSLLVQHPEHRVVYQAATPAIYQIHAGRVTSDGYVDILEEHLPYGSPTLEGPTGGESLVEYVARLAVIRGWSWQGIVCKDGQSGRLRVRSATYQMVRSMRGNTTRNDVRFVQLYQANLVDTYLHYYPEEAPIFGICKQRLRTTVKLLYDRYVRYHITKTLTQDEVEYMWRPHLFHLHGKYLYTLRSKGQFIREKDVWEYALGLPWQQLLFIMNRRETAPAHMAVATGAGAGATSTDA